MSINTEENSQSAAETVTETAPETLTETTINENSQPTNNTEDFTDIEDEIKQLNKPKQTYEKAVNSTQKETEPDPEEESDQDQEEKKGKKEAEKAIDSEFVDEGAEMIFNVSDFAFSNLNSWLNKKPDEPEDFEATQKGRRLIIKNLKAYFRTYQIKITPGQALFYSYLVVYGLDLVTGLFIRIKDLFIKLWKKKSEPKPTARPTAKANEPPPAFKTEPPEPPEAPISELTEEQIKKALRSKKEENYRKQGLKPCENTTCDKDEGFNQWCAKDRKFCSGSCRTIVQNQKKKDEKKKK